MHVFRGLDVVPDFDSERLGFTEFLLDGVPLQALIPVVIIC